MTKREAEERAHMTPEYRKQIAEAYKLTPAECKRYALISQRNKCKCLNCFTCACDHVHYQNELAKRRHHVR